MLIKQAALLADVPHYSRGGEDLYPVASQTVRFPVAVLGSRYTFAANEGKDLNPMTGAGTIEVWVN